MKKMTINYQYIFAVVLFYVSQVLADLEICDDGMSCPKGQECCDTGCCYSDGEYGPQNYGHRLSIWNMWYFWFVVLFILMSCFGGCGYYKQRNRVVRTPAGLGNGFLSVFQVTSRRTPGTSAGVTISTGSYPHTAGHYGYSGRPNQDTSVVMAPPPYSEVVNNPDLFNSKSGLPSSPQPGFVAANIAPGGRFSQPNQPESLSANQMPQPPPYSEIVNDSTAGMFLANQNGLPSNQTTNQS